jgi:hypothetical protein
MARDMAPSHRNVRGEVIPEYYSEDYNPCTDILEPDIKGGPMDERPPDTQAVLIWICDTCGWECPVPMPGYAGDGYQHYQGDKSCGPLYAIRAPGFLRMTPGTPHATVVEQVRLMELGGDD